VRAFDRAGNASEPTAPVRVVVENGATGRPNRAFG